MKPFFFKKPTAIIGILITMTIRPTIINEKIPLSRKNNANDVAMAIPKHINLRILKPRKIFSS